MTLPKRQEVFLLPCTSGVDDFKLYYRKQSREELGEDTWSLCPGFTTCQLLDLGKMIFGALASLA